MSSVVRLSVEICELLTLSDRWCRPSPQREQSLIMRWVRQRC